MKKSTILIACVAIATLFVVDAKAQTMRETHKTDVVFIGGGNLAGESEVVFHFKTTQETGFQASKMPRFVISTRDRKFMFGLGGFVNFRAAYDFDGAVQNTDFVTSDIPVIQSPAERQGLSMDASTTRLFFKSITRTSALGPIVTYIETDFRGQDHNLRLRKAYIAFKGLLFGKNVTTFCDLNSAPNTIDFQGPNAYTWNYALMARFTHIFNQHWSMSVAIEQPIVSATYTNQSMAIPQRIPDIPLYVQYAWGNGSGHIRASGILRNMYYHDQLTNSNKSDIGWGAQLSMKTKVTRKLSTFGQVVYGEGITPYIQDVSDMGLDMIPDPKTPGKLTTLPMFGWFAGLQYNFSRKVFCSATYSSVRVLADNKYFNTSGYRNAQYVVGNIFYNITSSMQVGAEYLYGMRKNFSMEHNNANRIQAMIQYNF